LTLDEYQYKAHATAVYPDAGRGTLSALAYCSLGLAGESGEVANKVKKFLRDGDSPEKRKAISKEIGDCLWYVAQICTELDIELSSLAYDNINKLLDRKERGVLKGNGDDR
jgi:NTP pyrophosphatase (non-canonical NTP hydrolase)